MTIKRAKNILGQQNSYYHDKQRSSAASSYFTAAMIALLLAVVVLLLGLALIDYEVGSYFEERPMINIVLPPDN